MNMVLIFPPDLDDTGSLARLAGRRFLHIRDVLRAGPGDRLAVGMVNGRTGSGTVRRMDGGSVELQLTLDRDPPAGLPLTLLLALPRPKVLRRMLRSLALFGVKRIVLMNAARVEKSYWQTPFLEEDRVREQLLLGLEQSRDTVLPEVRIRKRFRPFVEDELPALAEKSMRLTAHPAGAEPCPRAVTGSIVLAVGPEGGFVDHELEMLRLCGFRAVSLGERTLSVETALPALLGRLF